MDLNKKIFLLFLTVLISIGIFFKGIDSIKKIKIRINDMFSL